MESLCRVEDLGEMRALRAGPYPLRGFLPPNMFYHLMLEFFKRLGGQDGAAERRERGESWRVVLQDRAGACVGSNLLALAFLC